MARKRLLLSPSSASSLFGARNFDVVLLDVDSTSTVNLVPVAAWMDGGRYVATEWCAGLLVVGGLVVACSHSVSHLETKI